MRHGATRDTASRPTAQMTFYAFALHNHEVGNAGNAILENKLEHDQDQRV